MFLAEQENREKRGSPESSGTGWEGRFVPALGYSLFITTLVHGRFNKANQKSKIYMVNKFLKVDGVFADQEFIG